MNKFYALIPNNLYRDEKSIGNEIVAFLFLQMMYISYSKFTDEVRLDKDGLLYYIYGERYSRRDADAILEGIKVGDIFNPADFAVPEGEKFAQVPVEAVQKIMRSNNNGKFKIVHYFVWMMGTRNPLTKVGNMSVEWLADKCGISERTANRYNAVLEELGVMYFCRKYKNKNLYCLYEDRENIKGEPHSARSLAAKLRFINENFDIARTKYSQDELEEIYQYGVLHGHDISKIEMLLLF